MDISESFRVSEDIAKPSDLFDFVVNPNDSITTENSLPQFNRSLKSLGIYLETASLNEANNNNNNECSNEISDSNNNNSCNNNDECDKLVNIDRSNQKEQNNNNLLITNGEIQYIDNSQSYWSSSALKDDPVVRWEQSMLEDLNCWNQENGSNSTAPDGNPDNSLGSNNTDGAIYTLTVLNGANHNSSTWYRLPDNAAHENENPPTNPHHSTPVAHQTSSVTPSIDFDSLLNNILPNSIQPLANSSSFSSYITVNSQELIPARNPETNQSSNNQSSNDTTSSPIKPTDYIYENSGYHEDNNINSNRGTPRIPIPSSFNSSAENPNSSNSNSSSNSNNNRDWKLPTDTNQSSSPVAVGSDSRVNSLLRNALQGKSSSFTTRYNGSHNIRTPPHSVAIVPTNPASTKLCEKSDVTCKDVAASVTATTTASSGFSDLDESMKTHSPLMAVSLEGGTVVMFDGGQGTGSMLIDSDNPSSAQSMDDIFLSHLDTVNYSEDYEKLKSIEHEVAKSVEQYCTNPYFTTSTHLNTDLTRLPSISHHLDHALLNAIPTTTSSGKNSKKYTKRSSSAAKTNGSSPHSHQLHQNQSGNSGSGGSSGGGIRKERSLHYCTICHKGFKDKYSVNVHVRTHTGEKPFTCTFCGKNFRQKAHLAKHHHTHSVQKSGTSNPGNNSPSKPQNSKHR